MSNLIVKVKDTEISSFEGVSAKGKAYKIVKQENVFFELNDERLRLPLTLEPNTSPYSPGSYTVDPVLLLKVGQYGLEVDKYKAIKLVPAMSAVFLANN